MESAGKTYNYARKLAKVNLHDIALGELCTFSALIATSGPNLVHGEVTVRNVSQRSQDFFSPFCTCLMKAKSDTNKKILTDRKQTRFKFGSQTARSPTRIKHELHAP